MLHGRSGPSRRLWAFSKAGKLGKEGEGTAEEEGAHFGAPSSGLAFNMRDRGSDETYDHIATLQMIQVKSGFGFIWDVE